MLLEWIKHRVVETRKNLSLDVTLMDTDDVLCSLLHECGESVHDIISQCYTKVNDASSLINAARLFPIISVMTHCNWIEFARFSQVDPDEGLVELFAEALCKCKYIEVNI